MVVHDSDWQVQAVVINGQQQQGAFAGFLSHGGAPESG
jgi:hypothetical protein